MKKRCAIYTRKSTEEGLDQAFNSLHAQREACEAYIKSQSGEGWALVKTAYDDGGFSGGSMTRPALALLLDDIAAGRIDVVVVYKVDRLTRSLMDFSKIVEAFDAQGVSFVSITQAFNTTTSMGRLTLNVLLSFAQFEREVIAERIRDKIAASKAKGMWTGGGRSIGYDIVDKKLVVNEEEAERVRQIFQRYLEVESVYALAKDLEARAFPGKRWVAKNGKAGCSTRWSLGVLLHLLRNRLYRGLVHYRGVDYPGQHEAIVPEALWDAVRAKIGVRVRRKGPNRFRSKAGALAGMVFDDNGNRMTPVRQARGQKMFRYYVSTGLRGGDKTAAGSLARVRADRLEELVDRTLDEIRTEHPPAELEKVVIAQEWVEVSARWPNAEAKNGKELETRRIDCRLQAYLNQARQFGPEGAPLKRAAIDHDLLARIARARRWADELEAGARTSIADIAGQEGLPASTVTRDLKLAWLPPSDVEALLVGVGPSAVPRN